LAVASSQGIAILFPDTSPRGAGVPGEDDDWDFGTGAGFYLDATKPEYTKHYNMATHVTVELPQVIEAAGLPVVRPCHSIRHQTLLIFFVTTVSQDFKRQSIFGHSMGGHGALTLYLASKTKQYRSASAFSPITNPSECAWGKKAFNGYLQGGITEGRNKYDATELISKSKEPVHILIDYARIFFLRNFDHDLFKCNLPGN
jgi:S-formylglutathione hydrolase